MKRRSRGIKEESSFNNILRSEVSYHLLENQQKTISVLNATKKTIKSVFIDITHRVQYLMLHCINI